MKGDYVDYDRFDYDLEAGFVFEMVCRYFAMLFRIVHRPMKKNLTFSQLARWYDMPNDVLGDGFLQRLWVRCIAILNLVVATIALLFISFRVQVPSCWARRVDVMASGLRVGEVVNRHRVRENKVREFMCNEVVLDIPIVVSMRDGDYYIEDGHHRHEARRRRGFSRIRAVII